MGTKPTVCFIESLGFLEEETHREGEIISRTLRLSNKRSAYVYVRSKEELAAFAEEFGDTNHRYLHISCHGNKKGFFTSTGRVDSVEMAKMFAPHLKGRRVFVSSCLAAQSNFATSLLGGSGCLSVLAPVNKINFDDAAIFWTAFYHLMFKVSRDSMSNKLIEANVELCASLVGERFRLFTRNGADGKLIVKSIGPLRKPDTSKAVPRLPKG